MEAAIRTEDHGAQMGESNVSTGTLREVLELVAEGQLSISDARERFAHLPFEDLGFARVDHHRAIRGLGPEVVYARSKTPAQVAAIVAALLRREGAPVLVTKADRAHALAVLDANPEAAWHERSGMIVLRRVAEGPPGTISVLCAGTSDLPVAEEAVVTADAFGCRVDLVADVGVAGPHRLFAEAERLRRTDVLIVVAGMEGALPSLAAGLFGGPVLAVPTSVGYGAAFEGLAALLGMLNSCALGVSVVNIDNGFGAGVIAARILAGGARREVQATEPGGTS
jgi:NCAIR mutase (PurE)-related protein